jgi:thiol-disulfide isomerase/thioredoxin
MKSSTASIGLLAIVCLGTLSHAEPTPATQAPVAKTTGFQVGSPAPAVKFGTFFKGDEITELDPTKSYLIECWATWCGPCIAAFPHLTEIAKATAGKVTVIGVCVSDKKTDAELQTFVDKQGAKMGYSVTVDTHEVISNDWLNAVGARGIPHGFLVVKGRLAWSGHPGDLKPETVLDYVEGKINIDEKAKAESARMTLEKEIEAKVFEKFDKGDLKGAVAEAQALIKEKPAAAEFVSSRTNR